MIYKYCITAPLKYNRFDINSDNPNGESRYDIQPVETNFNVRFITREVPGEELHSFDDKVTISLYTELAENSTFEAKENSWTKSMPDRINPYFICKITGILVDDEKYAKKFTKEILDKICKGLSFLLIGHNENRHLFQPRVEPDWTKVRWDKQLYNSFITARTEALDKMDPTAKHLEEHIMVSDSCYFVSNSVLPVTETEMRTWLLQKDDIIEFLMNEYYCALGSEKIKSKFFHLFSIIEFCEQQYADHNGARAILTKEQSESILDAIDGKLNDMSLTPDEKNNIKSGLNSLMLKMNDTGRTIKLLNILKWMGIVKYTKLGKNIPIEKKLLDEIIGIRNKLFHGGKEKVEDSDDKYRDAVEHLLYIDEQIISYLKSHVVIKDNPDGICLITGQGVKCEE